MAPLKASAQVGPDDPTTLPAAAPTPTVIPIVPPSLFDELEADEWKVIGTKATG